MFPVISNTKWLLNLGLSYLENRYQVSADESKKLIHPLNKTMVSNGLTSLGANATLFKPLNDTRFLLTQWSFDFNGDYNSIPNPNTLKVSAALVYGIKKHDRRQWGLGVARTYRVGELNYIPIVLYNYTFPNKKWGIETLLPARGAIRYTANARNIILGGFELEGNSYRLNSLMANNSVPYNNLELRRSELRFRLTYEVSLYKFIWLSTQLGYRYNYSFNLDEGEFFRGFHGTQQYVSVNKLSNPIYFNISINLVSP